MGFKSFGIDSRGSFSGGPQSIKNYLSLVLIFLISLKYFIPKYYQLKEKRRHEEILREGKSPQKTLSGLEAIPILEPLFPIKFVGNIPIIFPFSKALENVGNCLKKCGDIVRLVGMNETVVYLNSAPAVEALYKSNDFGHVSKYPFMYEFWKPFVANGVAMSNGEFWRKQRKILMTTQTFSSLKGYMEMLNKHSADFVMEMEQLFKDGKYHQINEQINRLFLKIITDMLFGNINPISEEKFNDYHHNFQIWKEYVARRYSNPLLHPNIIWNLLPRSRTLSKSVKYLLDFARQQVRENRGRRAELSKGSSKSENTNDDLRCVLDELIDGGLDDEQIVDEMNTMLGAGHETAAATIHFFCHLISLHPEMQKKCQQEIDLLFESSCNNNDELIFTTVQSELKYLERAILETLRLYPPGYTIFRKLKTALDIENQGEKIRLPVGTNIAVCSYLMHRKEEYYPEPEIFNPDRFLPEERAKRNTYSFLAFSAGPRSCLGMKFAMLELKTVAAYILRNFEIMTTDKIGEIQVLPYLTLTPEKDYTFYLKRRTLDFCSDVEK